MNMENGEHELSVVKTGQVDVRYGLLVRRTNLSINRSACNFNGNYPTKPLQWPFTNVVVMGCGNLKMI
jgi:hypothetical protein